MHRARADDQRPRPAGFEPRTIAMALVFGLVCAGVTFFWSIARYAPETVGRAVSRGSASDDPMPGWGTLARRMMRDGLYSELAASASARRRDWGRDPEAWLFGAFAHGALARRPGLDALEHAAIEADLWNGLLALYAPGLTSPAVSPLDQPMGDYFTGWAYLGLGRPVIARERFGRYAAAFTTFGSSSLTSYNRACYMALAGDADGALREWASAVRKPILMDMRWVVVDPDLELIHDDLWANDLTFRVWRVAATAEGWGQRQGGRRGVPSGPPVQ